MRQLYIVSFLKIQLCRVGVKLVFDVTEGKWIRKRGGLREEDCGEIFT